MILSPTTSDFQLKRRSCLLLSGTLFGSRVLAQVDSILGCPKNPEKIISPEDRKKQNDIYTMIRTAQIKEPIPKWMEWSKKRHIDELQAAKTPTTPRAMTFLETQRYKEQWKLVPIVAGRWNLNIDNSIWSSVCASLEQKNLLKLLSPHAAHILYYIGNAFHKKFSANLKITSLNRNHEYVAALQNKNSNAANESSHEYGTTFDISYLRLISGRDDIFLPIEQRKFLENLLFALQKKWAISVTKEQWQSCYHVFCRSDFPPLNILKD